jgi:3-hydroxyacyl-[acyl-carrier-protein] dehydratase
VSIYLFVGVDGVRFKRQVVPGDQLELKVDYVSDRRGLWKFQCSSFVDGELAASASILCADKKV